MTRLIYSFNAARGARLASVSLTSAVVLAGDSLIHVASTPEKEHGDVPTVNSLATQPKFSAMDPLMDPNDLAIALAKAKTDKSDQVRALSSPTAQNTTHSASASTRGELGVTECWLSAIHVFLYILLFHC